MRTGALVCKPSAINGYLFIKLHIHAHYCRTPYRTHSFEMRRYQSMCAINLLLSPDKCYGTISVFGRECARFTAIIKLIEKKTHYRPITVRRKTFYHFDNLIWCKRLAFYFICVERMNLLRCCYI